MRLERKAGASFRMDPQNQQEAERVRLEGKTRTSFRMELQGQNDAEARVATGAALAVSTAWTSGRIVWNSLESFESSDRLGKSERLE